MFAPTIKPFQEGDVTQDRGQLGRELAQVNERMQNRPREVQRAAALRGLQPARHSMPNQPLAPKEKPKNS